MSFPPSLTLPRCGSKRRSTTRATDACPETRCEAREPVKNRPESEGKDRRRTDHTPAKGDARPHHAHRQYPQRKVAQLPCAGGKPPSIGVALAERLQGRQALDAVEKLRAEGLERPLAPVAGVALALREGAGRDQGHERGDQHHRRNRHVPDGGEDEERERRQNRDAEVRDVLPKKRLELLNPIDDREHYPASALPGEPCRTPRR